MRDGKPEWIAKILSQVPADRFATAAEIGERLTWSPVTVRNYWLPMLTKSGHLECVQSKGGAPTYRRKDADNAGS